MKVLLGLLFGFLREKLSSRKLWLGLLGVVIAYFADQLGISHDTVTQILGILGITITGLAVQDHAKERSKALSREALSKSLEE